MTEPCDLSAHDQLDLLRSRKISAVELLDAHLVRIAEVNPSLNAIVALNPDVGRARATAVDARSAAGEYAGPLAGLVTAHKDLTDTKDFPTTYGSPIYADHRPTEDSLLVRRMTEAGAVAVGKTNTPELGAGSHTFNPIYGTTLNPFDTTRAAGGSSGGAGVALQSGMVAIADGSDLGGSLRNPAAWNNVVGFRTSMGVIPHPKADNPYASFGITGAMGRSVDDMALLLSVLAAPDVRDPTNRGLQVPTRISPVGGPVRVAWSETLGGLPIEPEITSVVSGLRSICDSLGWQVTEAEPDFSGADRAFETLRSWGIANSPEAKLTDRLPEMKQTIQDEIRRGQALTGADIADALAVTKLLWDRAISFFSDVDVLIAPVTQVSPFPIGQEYPTEINGVPMERYITWMRVASRITQMGLPALSLPAGFTAAGLPVGAQLIGAPRGDLALLQIAKTLESAAG
ncbi:MAG: amidase family protein [Acidimicrobiales bacterium]